VQAFYTKFYIPEKDLYAQEVECTDKLSRALVVCTFASQPTDQTALYNTFTQIQPEFHTFDNNSIKYRPLLDYLLKWTWK